MTPGRKRTALAAIAGLLSVGALAYGITAFALRQSKDAAPSTAAVVAGSEPLSGPRIVFRNTAEGQGYGEVAMVPLSAPAAARTLVPIACDRVDASDSAASCLHIDRGVVTGFNATLYDADWTAQQTWPLAGIPSRTRLSPDGALLASTAFVTGHGYATIGFSTETVIRSTDGAEQSNLEEFALTVDGEPLTATDRNFWGVTFSRDGNTFYATAASGGRTWLVRGDLSARTLSAIRENAECPSLSPDESKIAYKKNISETPTAQWAIAVLDVASGTESVLPESRSVDDQIEWLDDSTLLYGLPGSAVGDSDVWRIDIRGDTEPILTIAHAWSPAVVR